MGESALNFNLDFYNRVGIFFKTEVAGEEEPLVAGEEEILEGEMEAVTQVDPSSSSSLSLLSLSSSLSFGQ